jgi:hypothetical protein
VINSFRSERGWWDRRRIAVLISLTGVLGVATLWSADGASAASVASCSAKLEPKGKGASTNAKLSFVCNGPVRAYGVGSNRPIKNYSNPSGGGASQFVTCQGSGVGFGCGITNRAAPGTQAPRTTGWNTTTPGAPTSSTANPTTCGGFKRVQGEGTGLPPGPNINAITGVACTQLIAAGTHVVQNLKLKSSPCAGGPKNPFQLFLFVGGEPPVTAFVAATSAGPGGDTTTVGEYIQGPISVNLKAYKKACAKSGDSSGKQGGAKKSASPQTNFPVSCSGTVSPASTPAGALVRVSFSCTQNIRAFGIYSNKAIVEPGEEPEVEGTAGGGVNESALHQCEGDIPGPGYGCGIVDRQTVPNPASAPALPNGGGISAGNTASQRMAFEFSPCQKQGDPKTKVWLVPMGEPTIGSTVGEWVGAPQQLALRGYGKCKGGKKK